MQLSANRFYSKDRFFSYAAWRDHGGPCLLWPAAWLEKREPVLDTHILRVQFGFLRWRFLIDLGHILPEPVRVDWEHSGLSGLSAFARARLGKGYPRPEIEEFLVEHPEWEPLLLAGAGRFHYGRILLCREMDMQSAEDDAAIASSASVNETVRDGLQHVASQ